eukprot:TRINITY_DN2089_c0_g2_i5.p1 TRINITY_DN2089_c0_g2~~TRINITY_DN2089_c0_g2_i5.p1  ORF type:complete len:373 (+),score=63.59 TRINITY_DN2089_c0_g2_i5:142-1260(+)
MTDKPRFIVCGGSGFIGRHLVRYLFDNKLASYVLIADKVPHQIAGLSRDEMAIYSNKDFCHFKQVDLKQAASVERLFDEAGGNYDFVINLAAVTKYSQAKEVYDANIVELARTVAAESAKRGVKRLIQVSTAQVYKKKKPAKEDAELQPWTGIALAHAEAEKVVQATPGLNFIIVRPATVYGTGDTLGLTPRLIIGSIHKELNKRMECLYDKSLRLNTVHVDDVAKALVFLSNHGESGSVFNLADKNDTDLGKINTLLEEVFGIKTGFISSVMMTCARQMGTKFLVGFANDEHLKPWSDACRGYGILDTPLTPYLDEELIKETPVAVDGSAIETLGFSYDHPHVTASGLTAVLDDYVDKGFLPSQMSHVSRP